MQFSEVVGQEALKGQLIQEVKSGKISHAQLFLGNEGYGTLPLVLAFVQYLFCEQKGETDSCGTCASCTKVKHLQHPDVHFSFPTVLSISKIASEFFSNWRSEIAANPYFSLNHWTNAIDPKGRKPVIGSEESYEIIKRLALKSYEGGYKVMIIWCADEMNTTSANRLLKILEEPPKNTLFLLISNSQDAMLQTILSRTQLVKVPRISTEELSLFLRNKHGLNAQNADSIAARAEGDLILANEFALNGSDSTDDQELFVELMRVCYKKDVLLMLDWAEKVGNESRERQKAFLKYCLHMFRQSMLKNYTEDILLRVSEGESKFLQNFSRFITGNNIGDFMETFNDGHYYIERNANPKILFTNICFKVMRYIHAA